VDIKPDPVVIKANPQKRMSKKERKRDKRNFHLQTPAFAKPAAFPRYTAGPSIISKRFNVGKKNRGKHVPETTEDDSTLFRRVTRSLTAAARMLETQPPEGEEAKPPESSTSDHKESAESIPAESVEPKASSGMDPKAPGQELEFTNQSQSLETDFNQV